MRQWHDDLPVMKRREREERQLHSALRRPYEECECFGKLGLWRKRHPDAECNRGYGRTFVAIDRADRKSARKRDRREARNVARRS